MRKDFANLFKNRQFTLLWLDQALSQISYNLLNFSLLVLVYKLTHSTFAVSVMVIFFYLPALFFSLPAGVISDFSDKKKVMFWANILWALSVFLIFLNRDKFWGLLFFTFLAKFFDVFFFPSEAAALPLVVKKEDLVHANSLFSLTTYGGMVIGFGLAGPLMRFVGQGAPLVTASFLTILAAGFVLFLNPLKGEPLVKKINFYSLINTVREKAYEGLSFLRSSLVVLGAIILSVLGQVSATVVSNLVPEYVEKNLRITAEDASFVLILPVALGIVCGLYIINKHLKHQLKRIPLRLGLILVSLAFLGLSLAPLTKSFLLERHIVFNGPLGFERLLGVSAVVALFSLILGCGTSLVLTPALTFSQQKTPPDLRGRAFGFYGTLTAFLVIGLVVPLGGFVELIGVPAILAALSLITAVLWVISLKLV